MLKTALIAIPRENGSKVLGTSKGRSYRRAFFHVCDFFLEMRRRSVAIRQI